MVVVAFIAKLQDMKIAPTKIRRQISNFFIGLSSCEIVILVVDDLGSDVADNIEVQNERALVLVRTSIVATNLGHTEVNKVVAVRLLVVIDPTDNSAGFGALETEQKLNDLFVILVICLKSHKISHW